MLYNEYYGARDVDDNSTVKTRMTVLLLIHQLEYVIMIGRVLHTEHILLGWRQECPRADRPWNGEVMDAADHWATK